MLKLTAAAFSFEIARTSPIAYGKQGSLQDYSKDRKGHAKHRKRAQFGKVAIEADRLKTILADLEEGRK
jgi:hypothetical protein